MILAPTLSQRSKDIQAAAEIDLSPPLLTARPMDASMDAVRSASQACVICSSDSEASKGLYCNGPERHYHCADCTTAWCSELNKQRHGAPDLLVARKGLFPCTYAGCSSEPCSVASVVAIVNNAEIAEEFVKNLLHVHTLAIREVFETELAARVAEVRAAGANAESQAEAAQKIERASLVETLRLTLRSPKMCPRCKYGPVDNEHCSDLSAHHGQFMRGATVAVNNSCPRCQYYSEHWSSWVDWDGKMPEETAGEWAATAATRSRVPCRFFSQGFCSRGSACTFAHDAVLGAVTAAEVTQVVSAQRAPTVLCRHFARGDCSRGNTCTFAHGPIRAVPAAQAVVRVARPQGARMVPCHHFARGTCSRGNTCTFAHGPVRVTPPGRPQAVPCRESV